MLAVFRLSTLTATAALAVGFAAHVPAAAQSRPTAEERTTACRAYADSAVESYQENVSLGCGFGGGRFSDDWDGHFRWCRGAASEATETETRLREEALRECRATKPGPTAPIRVFTMRKTDDSAPEEGTLSVPVVPAFTRHAATHLVDAALSTNEYIYLFEGDTYLRYGFGGELDLRRSFPALHPGYPRAMPGGWRGLPPHFHRDLDAALFDPRTRKIYFFKGNEYVRISGTQVDPGYPQALPGGWEGLPAGFWPIDAALAQNGRTYLFSGNTYARFTNFKLDRGYPRKLPGGWQLPSSFEPGIGAALDSNRSQRAVLFSGGDLAQMSDTRLDSGFPRPIHDVWRGLPELITAVPQGTVQLTLEPGFEPNLQLAPCVRVTGYQIPEEGYEAMLFALRFYPWTGTYCPGDWKQSSCSGIDCVGKALGDVVEGVAAVWDGFTELVDDLKTELTQLAAKYNPFCLQAGLASADAAAVCEKLVEVGGSVAIDAYLLANGIPPTLPTSSELLEMAKGDLEELALRLLDSAGLPCDELELSSTEAGLGKQGAASLGLDVSGIDTSNGFDVCRQVIRASIEEFERQARNALSEQTAQATGLPYFPSVVIVPEPRAQVQPLRVRARLDNALAPCVAKVSVDGAPQGTRGVRGPRVGPFRPKTVTLVPGRWVSVVLDEPNPLRFELNESWREAREARGKVAPSDYSNLLLADNILTATLTPIDGSCFLPATVQARVQMASSRPRGFPPKGAQPEGFAAWQREQCRGLPRHPPQRLDDTAGQNGYMRWVSLGCGNP